MNFALVVKLLIFCNHRSERNWNQVSNNVKPNANFGVGDLEPATWYHLRVTAHNNAGFTVAEYEFATLTITGGKSCFLSVVHKDIVC